MKFRLNDILNFMEASRCRTLTEAALSLEISQPALSESIKRLEEDLGVVLFYRSRVGIELTPEGRNLLTKGKNLKLQIDDIEKSSDSSPGFQSRKITIGCHPTVAQYTLPGALKKLESLAPDFLIEFHHDLSRHIQIKVQKGLIDIGIVINAVSVPDLVVQKVGEDIIGVWQAKKVEAQSYKTIFAHLDLFQVQAILKKWKRKPDRLISSESLELIARLSAEGLGYGILPRRAVHVMRLPLTLLENLPTYRDEIFIVYRPEFGRSSAERMTIEALRSVFRDL